VKFYAKARRTPTVIIVSLIDIFAILLIFVIVTTTFIKMQPEVAIRLPESTTAGPSEQDDVPVILSLTKDSDILLNGQSTTIKELPALIEGIVKSEKRIALSADEEAPFGLIIKVLDALKTAGVTTGVSAFTKAAP